MRKINKSAVACFGALLLLAACSPDNPGLGDVIPQSELSFSITQNPEKDNTVYLESKTPGIIPYWDYGIGFSNEEKTTINIPFAGQHEIKYYAFDKGGSVFASQTITVSKNDEEFFSDPMWNFLTDGSAGKTWVWHDRIPACFGNGGPGSIVPEWWQLSYEGVIAEGFETGEMVFDLNGAQNFSKTSSTGETTKGLFKLDTENKRLTILGANIIHGANYQTDGAEGNYYVITRLTETEMTLSRQGDGWQNTWVFRKK